MPRRLFATDGSKSRFRSKGAPADAALIGAQLETPGPVDRTALAGRWRRDRHAEPGIEATLAALTRLGLAASEDNGRTWRLRRSP